jgi:hypothetical protein
MPRVNLSISPSLYKQLQKAANKDNVTVNNLIYKLLEKEYGDSNMYDYVIALDAMITEAKAMDKEFTLSDLPTFATVNDVIVEYKIKESPAAVRARLGKMFNEAVKNGYVKGIGRAVIVEKNGDERLKFLSRAAVYSKKLSAAKAKKK